MDALDYFAPTPVRLDELYHANSKAGPARVELATAVEARRRDHRLGMRYAASRGRYKTYEGFPTVPLPPARALGSLDRAMEQRRSDRRFASAALSLEAVATLLLRSYGIAGDDRRVVPSGGGLYPLDLYLLQLGNEPMAAGVYHYHVGHHTLQCVAPACARGAVASASIYPEIVATAAMVFAVVADMKRSRVKYGERAYRLALLEAGHVSQGLYLVAAALGLGIVALDGFYDDRVHALLGVDGVSEIALLLHAVGARP